MPISTSDHSDLRTKTTYRVVPTRATRSWRRWRRRLIISRRWRRRYIVLWWWRWRGNSSSISGSSISTTISRRRATILRARSRTIRRIDRRSSLTLLIILCIILLLSVILLVLLLRHLLCLLVRKNHSKRDLHGICMVMKASWSADHPERASSSWILVGKRSIHADVIVTYPGCCKGGGVHVAAFLLVVLALNRKSHLVQSR